MPADCDGLRTLFNSFHHFRPDDARRILESAARDGRPIAVFELVSRTLPNLLAMLFAPLAVLLVMPFVRPRRWSWLALTYAVPAVPLLVVWDGLVSCLRSYRVDELEAMVSGIEVGDYTWRVGRIQLSPPPAFATYLVGSPAGCERTAPDGGR